MEHTVSRYVFETTVNETVNIYERDGWRLFYIEFVDQLPHGKHYNLWFKRRK